MSDATLLQIENLHTRFLTYDGVVHAVNGVDLSVNARETLGVVGESGSGKSVTALSVMRLLPHPRGRIVRGAIRFRREEGGMIDLARLKHHGREMRTIRGNDIAMIFQDPMSSLSPVYTIGNQIIEAIMLHQELDKKAARVLAIEMLDRVGIANPELRVDEYPHQLSGGMRQRAMIAMALSCRPRILIADEPTTALDVTIQAQILELMKELQQEYRMALVMITHDLGVIADIADRIVVMYLGKVVEQADVDELFYQPRHPYTQALLKSIPSGTVQGAARRRRLQTIDGVVPDSFTLPEGCAFADRCPYVQERCREEIPELETIAGDHLAACHFARELELAGVGES